MCQLDCIFSNKEEPAEESWLSTTYPVVSEVYIVRGMRMSEDSWIEAQDRCGIELVAS